MLESLKLKCLRIKRRLKDNSCSMLIWLLNTLPRIGGFPLMTEKIKVLFVVIHLFIQFYTCIVGTVAYSMYVADGFYESIKGFFNISIFGVVMNNTLWFLFKKKDLNELLTMCMTNDSLLVQSDRFVNNYRNMLRKIKIIILVSYVFHFVNDILLYLPHRIFFMDKFSVVSCVGLDVTSSPSREVCMLLLASQEIGGAVVVASFDVIVLFMFSHSTAVFQAIYEDMISFKEITDNLDNPKEITAHFAMDRIKNIVIRHSVLLSTVDKMQNIYTVAIGFGFAQNAISLCLFFVLPIKVSLSFGPLIYYSIFVFFLYCHYGQRLTNAAESFEKAVYSCGWEKLRVKEQKSILLILRQAQKPVVLRAGGIVPISIYTFASAMQSIYKFVTVFKL